MENITLELCRNISRFVRLAPTLKQFDVPEPLDCLGIDVVLSHHEAENTENFVIDGNFKQVLFKSAKTGKQKLYRDILFHSAEQPKIAHRHSDGRIVFSRLKITQNALNRYLELKQASISASVVGINHGSLCIGHRPKTSDLLDLRDEGFTHVVTVLAESEKAKEIGREVEKLRLSWIWLPLGSAKVPVENETDIRNIETTLVRLIPFFNDREPSGKVYLHCSAGMHRTGMITLVLLQTLSFSPERSKEFLAKLRVVTAQNVGEERIQWANTFAEKRDLTML